jgi:hypothetical protein
MYELLIKIIMILFILVVFYLIYNVYIYTYNLSRKKCELEKFDIDDIMVIKRTPEYSKLINKLIDDKSFIFNEQQLKSLKNPQQIFKLSKNNQDIKNISDMVYSDCNKELEFFNNADTYDYDYTNKDIDVDIIDNQYEYIKNKLKNDINVITEPNCTNIGVLKNNIPFSKNYLKNYYKDLYGNRIEADLKDYFTGYYTLINSDDNIGLPVNTQIGHSNFIIPDQYNYDSKFTNAYNIDWSRIINPIGYSM